MYSAYYYEYAKVIYNDLRKRNPDTVFGDEMVDKYLNTLLSGKTNSQ